ncbi:MAG: methionine--tRNA ligase [Candidatus Latescibacterota bacterium]|nr:MAG: methionine--tRNA ligase [Candidatus Latescibacterota bacterium]
MSKFYITTPIYYVNDEPHLGHAYTTILADTLARYHRLFGDDVFFLTGLDEHGQKVQQAAQSRGIPPQQHCDEMAERFVGLWRRLSVSNDDFLRTTQERHVKAVQRLLQVLYDRGEIYKAPYEGWYCVPDERFWTEKDLTDGKCPECGRPVVRLSEDNYFFKMGRHQDWLVRHIEEHPDFIMPETRRNEILGFLKKPLGDLCISRPKARLSWGIPLPFDPDYVTYVWVDALTNYLSAVGIFEDETRFYRWWPADLHLIGKDILMTHAVYWPTILHAAGIEPPRHIFAHGWWLVEEQKMSKSRGKVVQPLELIEKYGSDAFRYFLMREMAPGQDSNFGEEALVARYNSDLANDLGNLLSRVVRMIKQYTQGRVPAPGGEEPLDRELREETLKAAGRVRGRIEDLRVDLALEEAIEMARRVNRYLERTAPWKLHKEGKEDRVATVLYFSAEVLRILGDVLEPVMPGKAGELKSQLGVSSSGRWEERVHWGVLEPGTTVPGGPPLFPRVRPEERREPEGAYITLEEFQKLDIRVGEVTSAESVQGTRKLLRVEVDLGGEKRQLVAGLAEHYAPGELVGRKVIVLANLKPARIRGVESQGMLLAADDGKNLALIVPDREVGSGARVR